MDCWICGDMISRVGDDAIDYCNNCGVVEQ